MKNNEGDKGMKVVILAGQPHKNIHLEKYFPRWIFLNYGFSLFKTFAHRAGVLNYNPPALRVVIIVIRKNHLSAL